MSEPEKQTTQIPRLGMGYFWDLGLKSKFGTLYSPIDKASLMSLYYAIRKRVLET